MCDFGLDSCCDVSDLWLSTDVKKTTTCSYQFWWVEMIVVVVYSCWGAGGGLSFACTPGTCPSVSVMFSIG